MVPSTLSTPPAADNLEAGLASWRQTVEVGLRGVPFEKKLVTRTVEGIALQPVYTRADLAGVPHLNAQPGAAPFGRGVRNFGYKEASWEFCQEITALDAAGFNVALRADLMCGQNSVAITPDLAARAGCDPDEAPEGSVGAGGLSLADGRDIAAALDAVDLTAVPVHLRAGADALPLAALYLALAGQRGVAIKTLSGSLTADPLGAWMETGGLLASLASHYDSLAGWTIWAKSHAPRLRTIGVDATLWSEAGGSATQELAFGLAAGVEYLRELQNRGTAPAIAAARCRFSFAIGPQFFTEIAKFRAFRLLWSRVVSAFGAKVEASAKSAVHARTGRGNKTVYDPQVNLLRVTTEALSAVLGGCDSLHIGPYDEVAGASGDFSRRIARNVHTLLAEEFHFTATADPAGGSWYVEKLTDELARKAWTLFQEIEQVGGLAAALRRGIPQQLVAATAAEKGRAVDQRRAGLVGTNLFPNLKAEPLVVNTADPSFPSVRAAAIKARRGPAPRKSCAASWSGRFQAALAAAARGATVGQLARLGRDLAAQVEQAIQPLAPKHAAAGFEDLRRAADAFARHTGARPRVFLAKIGPVKQHKPRADFSAGFFTVGGFEVLSGEAFETAETAANAAVASGASVVALCSTDETHPALVPVFAREVKAVRPGLVVVLAGLPADPAVVEQYRVAGVDEFIHVRANVRALLAGLLKRIGART
ncbi:MAG TPA: methylmalonyl-CoA mutase family protein [Opitutaceae bacterium]|nr:methylmalonyl-CoA mutase family protein [Opitutaceae bacterium]